MRHLLLGILLTLVPAVGEARNYSEAGGWTIIELNDGCVMKMEFEGPGSTNLSVHVPIQPNASWVMVTNEAWSSVEHQKYSGFVMNLNGVEYSFPDAMGIKFLEQRGFLVKASPTYLDDFAKGSTLIIEREGALADRLSLTGTSTALAQARRCTANLAADQQAAAEAEERRRRKYSGIVADPFASNPSPAVPVVSTQRRVSMMSNPHPPIPNVGSTMTNDDYPPSAQRDRVTGTTTARVTVGPDGRVISCTATGPSQLLADTACRLIQRRNRYSPATDSQGKSTVGEVETKWEWQLPR